ncbi:hypothetical protein [Alkalihalobacillus pseudalcaliphilus]|nr:hypothetical protein [Alkalihalobacillus pseudalcaliphilus]
MGKYQFDTKGKQAVTKFHEKQKSAKPNKKQQIEKIREAYLKKAKKK